MDTTPTWKCQCGQEGTGFIPDECPTCEHYLDATLTPDGWKATLQAYQVLDERARHITEMLGHGCDSLDFAYAYREGGTFTTRWESANCRCGCSGYSTHDEDIPTRYLWMSDADIRAEEAAKKEATAKKEAEKQRLKALAQAEQELVKARAKAATAAEDAATALAKAEANLSALRWMGAP